MIEYNVAEHLFLKHFPGTEHKRRFYVWLGVGLINMLGGEVYGHYFEIPEGAKLWLHPFRISVDEPKFKRNAQDQIHGIIGVMLVTSYQEETHQPPSAEFSLSVSGKAGKVLRDYLVVFPMPEEN